MSAEDGKIEAKIEVSVEQTGDEQARKFQLSRVISSREVVYASSQEASISPIAKKIFGFPWTEKIEVGKDFVTVSKQDWVDWEVLEEPLQGLVTEHFEWAVAEAAKRDGAIEENPELTVPDLETPQAQQVQALIDSEINPAVAAHGGFVTLVDVKDDNVYVQFGGGCQGCSVSNVTLKDGIEASIKKAIPDIREVIDVTDHAAGLNPYA